MFNFPVPCYNDKGTLQRGGGHECPLWTLNTITGTFIFCRKSIKNNSNGCKFSKFVRYILDCLFQSLPIIWKSVFSAKSLFFNQDTTKKDMKCDVKGSRDLLCEIFCALHTVMIRLVECACSIVCFLSIRYSWGPTRAATISQLTHKSYTDNTELIYLAGRYQVFNWVQCLISL